LFHSMNTFLVITARAEIGPSEDCPLVD